MTPNATPIGQTLIHLGLISKDQLHIALREQGRSGEALGRQLVRLGFLSEATLRDALARTLDRPSADLAHLLPDAEALALVPQHIAKRLKLIPLSFDAALRLGHARLGGGNPAAHLPRLQHQCDKSDRNPTTQLNRHQTPLPR